MARRCCDACRIAAWATVLLVVVWPDELNAPLWTIPAPSFFRAHTADPATDGYILPVGTTDQPWTVQCKPPPSNFTSGYACEARQGPGADDAAHACLFNMRDDPCEHTDLSAARPEIVQSLMTRLEAYRATAVDGATATRNPDGASCPAVVTIPGCQGGGAHGSMQCAAKLPCGTA